MINNEKGSSLLVVLLMVTIFTVLGLSLLSLNVNSAKQVSRTGNALESTNLAEMGVAHFKESVSQVLNDPANKDKSLTEIKPILKSKLLELNNKRFRANVTALPYYSFEIIPEPVTVDTVNNKLIVSFTSVGNVKNQPKRISGTITTTKTTVDNFLSSIPQDTMKNPTISDGKEFTSPVYFENGLEIQGSIRTLVFLDGLYSSIVEQENKTIIIVEGDAHIRDELDLKANGNDALMCVEGTLYLYGTVNPVPTIDPNVNCETRKTAFLGDPKIYSGIFARDVQKKALYSTTWEKNQMLLNAEYK